MGFEGGADDYLPCAEARIDRCAAAKNGWGRWSIPTWTGSYPYRIRWIGLLGVGQSNRFSILGKYSDVK